MLDRELRHGNHVAIAKILEQGVLDVQFQGVVELVRHATFAQVDVAVHAAVGSVGVEVHHAGIL